MTDYKKPLDDARLELSAKIIASVMVWPIETGREYAMEDTIHSYDIVTKARRQTGSDALSAALAEMVESFDGLAIGVRGLRALQKARDALAAYERIAKP